MTDVFSCEKSLSDANTHPMARLGAGHGGVRKRLPPKPVVPGCPLGKHSATITHGRLRCRICAIAGSLHLRLKLFKPCETFSLQVENGHLHTLTLAELPGAVVRCNSVRRPFQARKRAAAAPVSLVPRRRR